MQASRDGVLITVDNGRGPGSPEAHPGGARHGLVGMTERAAAFGGTLDAGPAAGGGFQVTAFLPLARPSAAGPVPGSTVPAGTVPAGTVPGGTVSAGQVA